MEAILELIQTPPEVSWQCHVRREDRFDFHWHYHPECELTLITRGAGRRFVGDSMEEYRAGDLVFLAPALPHTYASDDEHSGGGARCGTEAVVVQFRPEFLGAGLFARPDLAPVGDLIARAARGLAVPASGASTIAALLPRLTTGPGPERTITLLAILLQLARLETRPLASSRYQPTHDHASSRRLDDICRYLHAHYDEPVTLRDVATVAHLTPAACSRFFHRAMGRTLTDYIGELRVGAACRLLVDTDQPVAQIAAACGYLSLANFNRRFRQLKSTTPTAYRAAFQGAPATRPA